MISSTITVIERPGQCQVKVVVAKESASKVAEAITQLLGDDSSTIKFTATNSTVALTLQMADMNSATSAGSKHRHQFRVTLTRNALEYLQANCQSFSFSGVADIDHLDFELEIDGKPAYLTFCFTEYRPPLSGDEVRRLLLQ